MTSTATHISSAKTQPRFEELPDLLTPQHLFGYIPIGKNAIYDLLRDQRIKNIRIGQKYIIPKSSLRDFLDADVE